MRLARNGRMYMRLMAAASARGSVRLFAVNSTPSSPPMRRGDASRPCHARLPSASDVGTEPSKPTRRGSGPLTIHAISPALSASAQFNDGPAQRSRIAAAPATSCAAASPTSPKFKPSASFHVACSASGRPSQSAATTGPQRVRRVSSRSGARPATAISATSTANASEPSGVR